MDGAAGAAITEDGAGNKPHSGHGASGNSVGQSAEDTANYIKQCSIACKDCGLKFTHWEVFKNHLHQHALEEEEEEEEEEEKEEAKTGENRNPAAELLPGRRDEGENREEDVGGAADGRDTSSSSQTKPSELMQNFGVGSMKKKLRDVYACLVCGKVYTYLVSFRKHQQLHENQSFTAENPEIERKVQNLHRYECPDCGMSFIRRTRLLGHMRVHRSRKPLKSKPPRCDQCNKEFTSIKSWMIHINIHKEKPFWCLSCAKGFRDEVSLDKHLQSHSLRRHKCDICHKSFKLSAQLMNHYNTHTRAKPYQCSFCGKTFSHSANLITHKKKHLRVYVGSSGLSLGIKNSATITKKRVIKKERPVLTSVKDEPEMDTNMEELLEKEGSLERSETQMPCEDAKVGDPANSEESDCGEPLHCLAGMAGSDPSDESKSETAQPRAGEDLDKNESQKTNMHREHKYWEWECFECDMGFDDVAKLHLHYIKHATGELPFPQDDIEG
ncbi:zinc finger protein 90 isoform X2 [Xiphias gladius]|uniref:zinc finger protein 90 isoform X2 n=1 Tax=Xiphias gladius TaxID=8245 RepID=UPI001A99E0CB|nr:zinc finger protein 90 isoform X2 [Xiphias gladius]